MATEIDWSAIEGKKAKDIPDAIKAPTGVWEGNIVSAQYSVREVQGKKDPDKTYTFREVMFEIIPSEMVNGDLEEAAKMSDWDKVDSRKWWVHRIDKRSDVTDVKNLLIELKAFDEDLPLFPSQDDPGQKTCLDLIGENGSYPKVQFELSKHTTADGRQTTKLGTVILMG